MKTATKLEVSYDDDIERSPDMFSAAKAASAYLEGIVQEADVKGLDRLELCWTHRPENPTCVLASVLSLDANGGIERFQPIPLRDMLDPVSRNTRLLRVWQDLLRELSRRADVRIGKMLSELEDTENGSTVAH
jgi:hypothetical protein